MRHFIQTRGGAIDFNRLEDGPDEPLLPEVAQHLSALLFQSEDTAPYYGVVDLYINAICADSECA